MQTSLKRIMPLIPLALAAVLLCAMPVLASHHESASAATKYVCGCGPDCNCGSTSDQPGQCACGKPLVEKKVLKEDDKAIYTCACPAGCNCDINAQDDSKCACGKDLKASPKAGQKSSACPMNEKMAKNTACDCCRHGEQKTN